MSLATYKKKRDFKATPEPSGREKKSGKGLIFVVQKHDASHLHYDFRLEMDGVLKSWAVPKGPSLDPSIKRLAMEVEDHPYDYKDFEGSIPEGNYGAGDVIVWDKGTYDGEGGEKGLLEALKKGRLSIEMYGTKLRGGFSLVRTGSPDRSGRHRWLLMKKDDEFASEEDIAEQVGSALSDRVLPRDKGKRAAPSAKAAPKRKANPVSARDISPMLATLAKEPFDRDGWIFEVKWDGYRLIADVGKTVSLISRNGIDVSGKYPEICRGLASLEHSAVIDGELVALDENGKPSFHLMQHVDRTRSTLAYYAFDLLFLDGKDMRKLPLVERKKKLEEILPKDPALRFSAHIERDGVEYFEAAKKQGLEGVMAKRAQSAYLSGKRTEDWLKIKSHMRQEVVVIGYTEPRNSRQYVGSLVLAVRDGREWRYVGHTGGSMGGKSLKEVHAMLKDLVVKRAPSEVPREVARRATWVEPELVCDVRFTEWTPDGIMRHPVVVGWREDKPAKRVVEEKEVAAPKQEPSPVRFTHTDKVFWPDEGFTKGDVISYYDSMSDIILPYLRDRPMVLNRHPNGVKKPGFFQKNSLDLNLPEFVETVMVHSESTGEDIRYVVCNNKETLLYLANLGVIELNPWNSRVAHLDNPDFLAIDLDPGDNTFEEVIEVAQVVHEVLEMSCERSFVKTSGKTGIHIFVPLRARYGFDYVRNFAELLVKLVHARLPDLTSLERSPSKRKSKIYLDWLQNRVGQTLASPYSLRPAEGATVSAPLEWSEVKKGLSPDQFTIETIRKRVEKKGDLWKLFLTDSVDLAESIRCLESEIGGSAARVIAPAQKKARKATAKKETRRSRARSTRRSHA